MKKMTHTERIMATLRGEWLDRPCVFIDPHTYDLEAQHASDLAKRTISDALAYNTDMIMVSHGSVYFGEAFGQTFYPRTYSSMDWLTVKEFPINTPAQMANLKPVKIENNALAREVECVKRVCDYFQGDIPVLPMVYSPFVWAGEMAGTFLHQEKIVDMLKYHEKEVAEGLKVIEEVNYNLMNAFIDAGAAGFFYGIQNGLNKKMGKDLFEEYEAAPSKRLLNAVKDRTTFTMLHACNGEAEQVEWVMDYPVDAIQWPSLDNPRHISIKEMRQKTDKVIIGGLKQAGTCEDWPAYDPTSDFDGDDRDAIKARLRSRIDTAIEGAGNKLIISGSCCMGTDKLSRMWVLNEVLDEVEADRAAMREKGLAK